MRNVTTFDLEGDIEMRWRLLAGGLTVLVAGVSLGVLPAAEDEKPKHTIKEVMKEAHKDGLLKKVVGGTASKEDKSKLLELYQSLPKNSPPKGEKKDWDEKTKAIVAAAQEVVDGKEGAIPKLEKAANCAECHKAHKK